MWEYKRVSITYKSHIDLDEELQKLGDNDWEIIYYYEIPNDKYEIRREVDILAKRPKKNENKNSN